MTLFAIVKRSVTYHWRTNLAIMFGVAAAVAVLAGALLVGDSVRGSLRDIALGRLGHTDVVVASAGFFDDELADRIGRAPTVSEAAPLVVARGFVTSESSRRRAGDVLVYGVDERFWRFHGLEPLDGVYVSPALAGELETREGDVLLARLQRPSEIPIESLFGRKDEAGRTLRLPLGGVLPREQLGEFALRPQQAAVRALFAPLDRIQRDLGVRGHVNTVLLAGELRPPEFKQALRLDDLGARVVVLEPPAGVALESTSGIVNEALESAARRAGVAAGLVPLPVFTYLANTIKDGERQIPYSLITATDLDLVGREVRAQAATVASADGPGSAPRGQGGDSIVLNEWAARELSAAPGDRIDIEYYLWDPAGGLSTRTASFTLARVVPIAGLAADRHLAPEYPGITGSENLADWDPPFPLDLSRVREEDERYWDAYRTTPKAFITYERGRDLWRTRYGGMTSLRFRVPAGADPRAAAGTMAAGILSALQPQAMGLSAYPARRMALDASTGATDFGEYFTYFSFFIVVSAILLAVLFFRLGVEQRLRQIGIMRAAGYPTAVIRKLLLVEAAFLATLGAAIGVIGAIGYAELIVHGLKTWWIGAVGTQLLDLHINPVSLAIGAVGGVLAALFCVVFSLRSVARLPPRMLLTGQSLESTSAADVRRMRWRRRLAAALLLTAVAQVIIGFVTPYQAAAFFGAGSGLLVASLLWLGTWLRARDKKPITGRGAWPVARLGFRSASFRPTRSVLSAGLIAAATFIIVSVGAFRRGGGELTQAVDSGTGGYVLMARSELPLVHDPNEPSGREELLMHAPQLARARFTRFRVREGQDASCLNLYRPTNPTIVAPESGFIESDRFNFSDSLAESDPEKANPWLLLRRTFADGSVPVIADATSLQYVLHASVGDTFSIDTGAERPVVLRFVAALRDSVLQGELIVAEEQFLRLFPRQQGYTMFLVSDPDVETKEQAQALAGVLEGELGPFGLDAVTTVERLEEFHRVENTYLSTFQALGGLGLLLGTVGLAAVMFRNVLERRRELAVLRASGYDTRHLSHMILAESGFLLGTGLAAGALSAALAVAPAWLGRAGALPGPGLALLLVAVTASGLLSSIVAIRAASSGRLMEALRAE